MVFRDDEQRDNEVDAQLDINVDESSPDLEPLAVRYPNPDYQHHPHNMDTYDDSENSQPSGRLLSRLLLI